MSQMLMSFCEVVTVDNSFGLMKLWSKFEMEMMEYAPTIDVLPKIQG
jgi:hypothetical protein